MPCPNTPKLSRPSNHPGRPTNPSLPSRWKLILRDGSNSLISFGNPPVGWWPYTTSVRTVPLVCFDRSPHSCKTDKIEHSKYSAQIKMNLAQNIPIYQVPDTDDESLELLLGLISERPRSSWTERVLAHQNSPMLVSGPQRLPMIIRNTAFMVELIDLYRYSRHWSETIKISLFHKWRKSIFPVSDFKPRIRPRTQTCCSTSKPSSGKVSWFLTLSLLLSTSPSLRPRWRAS